MTIQDQIEHEAQRWIESAYNAEDQTLNLRALFPLLRAKSTYAAWRRTRFGLAGLQAERDIVSVTDADKIFSVTRLDGYTQSVANCFLGKPMFPVNRLGTVQVNVLVPAEREAELKAIAAKMMIDYSEI